MKKFFEWLLARPNLFESSLWTGFFRLSLFVAFSFALWGAFVAAPYNIRRFATPIEFTEEEKDGIKNELLEEYKHMNPKTAEELAENILKFFYGHIHHGKVSQLGEERGGEREGRGVASTYSRTANTAINRIIDKYNWRDFSGGWIVQNKAYGISSIGSSEEGFSLIPGAKDNFFTALWCGGLYGLFSWIATALIIPLLLEILKWSLVLFFRYFRWMLYGFIGR